mmetsp:Transcript_89959/g.290662  ORF Transcript_89959/g.290662 Transcript_89959/m.290662 type:complete len:202 (-) Transcript_89959:887-1492(-)
MRRILSCSTARLQMWRQMIHPGRLPGWCRALGSDAGRQMPWPAAPKRRRFSSARPPEAPPTSAAVWREGEEAGRGPGRHRRGCSLARRTRRSIASAPATPRAAPPPPHRLSPRCPRCTRWRRRVGCRSSFGFDVWCPLSRPRHLHRSSLRMRSTTAERPTWPAAPHAKTRRRFRGHRRPRRRQCLHHHLQPPGTSKAPAWR